MAGRKNPVVIDVDSQLEALAGKGKVSAKKSSVPEVIGHESLTDQVYTAYQRAKDSEAVFRAAETSLLVIANEEYVKRAISGSFTKSLNFEGNASPGLQVSFSDKFQDVPLEKRDDLRAACGGEYDRLFFTKRKIAVNATSAENNETLAFLMKATGDRFNEIFDVSIVVAAKSDIGS